MYFAKIAKKTDPLCRDFFRVIFYKETRKMNPGFNFFSVFNWSFGS